MVNDWLLTAGFVLEPFLAIFFYFLMNKNKVLSNFSNSRVCFFEVGSNILLMLIKGLNNFLKVELNKMDIISGYFLATLTNHMPIEFNNNKYSESSFFLFT